MSSPALSESEQTYADQATALIESYARADLFDGSVLVASEGRPLYRRSFGLADREWNIPNAPDVKFRIGSVTKQFTAAVILQLAEHGKLRLDDPISDYYIDAPAAWKPITICHLLTHASGIPSYTALPDFDQQLSKIQRTPRQIIALTQTAPLEFEPGTQFVYDNTGYVLLGYIIEKVTGESYAQYLRKNIFDPLGMHDTGYDDSVTIVPRRASGYRAVGGHWENAAFIAMSLPFAAGSLYSTVDDLLLWDQGLSSGKVINSASLDAMFTDYGHAYGYGWLVSRLFDRRIQSHGGGINGFRSTIDRYPDDKLSIIVLSNVENAPVDRIARELAALRFGVSSAGHQEAPVDPAVFARYVGHYQLGPRFVLDVSRDGQRLFVQASGQPKLEVFAEGEGRFFYRAVDAQITFEGGAQGNATALVLHQNGTDRRGSRISGAEAERIAAQPPTQHKEVWIDPGLFDGLVGRYQLAPHLVLTISREGDRLFSQATGQGKVEIFPESERDFFLKAVDAQLTFETDEHGRAVRLIVHQAGLDTPAARID